MKAKTIHPQCRAKYLAFGTLRRAAAYLANTYYYPNNPATSMLMWRETTPEGEAYSLLNGLALQAHADANTMLANPEVR